MRFDIKPANPEALSDKTDLLLVFGSFLAEQINAADFKKALEKIETKVLFTSHENELNSLFDIVLPTALIPEKGGSLTNIDGKIQKFSPVFELPGDSLPEWMMLADLGRKFGTNSSFYKEFTTPESILKEIENEVPFFREQK